MRAASEALIDECGQRRVARLATLSSSFPDSVERFPQLPALLEFNEAQVGTCLRRRWQQMESWYALGRFQNLLPLEVRRASVSAAFDVPAFVRAFNGRRVGSTQHSA